MIPFDGMPTDAEVAVRVGELSASARLECLACGLVLLPGMYWTATARGLKTDGSGFTTAFVSCRADVEVVKEVLEGWKTSGVPGG